MLLLLNMVIKITKNKQITMDHNIKKLITKPNLEGQVGENAIWEGPLDTSGFPMSSGSSSGITGMKLKMAKCSYTPGPITKKAQGA
jgi:hypothetical protein